MILDPGLILATGVIPATGVILYWEMISGSFEKVLKEQCFVKMRA